MPATSFDPIASPTVAVSPPTASRSSSTTTRSPRPRPGSTRSGAAHGPRSERARDPHGRRRLGRLRLLRRRGRGRRADAEHRPARPRGPAADVVLLGAVVHADPGVAADRPAADAPRPAAPADVRRARRPAGRGHAGRAARPTPATSPRRSASGTWARTSSRSRRTSASTTSTASSRVSDMYTEWRDPYFFPEVVYSEARTDWVENMPFNRCFVHAERGGEVENGRGGHDPGALAARRQVVRATPSDFIRRMAGDEQPWFLYHGTRGAHFDNYPHERFLGSSPAKHPYKDTIIELDDIVGRLVAVLEETGQLEDTLIFLSSDNGPEMETWPDAAYTPFRCAKGSTWEGGVRVPGIAVVAGHDRGRPGQRRPVLASPTCSRRCSRLAGADGRGPRRPLHRRRRPDVVPARARRPCRTASTSTTGCCARSRRVRVGEYKFMIASTTDDDTDVAEPGRLHRRHPELHLRPAVQPLPGPQGAAQLPDPQAGLHRGLHQRHPRPPHELPGPPAEEHRLAVLVSNLYGAGP